VSRRRLVDLRIAGRACHAVRQPVVDAMLVHGPLAEPMFLANCIATDLLIVLRVSPRTLVNHTAASTEHPNRVHPVLSQQPLAVHWDSAKATCYRLPPVL
jgi:hypothetical protein